ncbi:MAG: hypothetical protein JXA17_00435 [Dehalococcoidales bacterium]|nr:hypothetical protein [Dehalococcoidales bacterium]
MKKFITLFTLIMIIVYVARLIIRLNRVYLRTVSDEQRKTAMASQEESR